MLSWLRLSNFAILPEIQIKFEPGFNVITGETGSGKSLLIKGLTMILGDRSRSELVGNRGEMAIVEAHFHLDQRPDVVKKLELEGLLHDDPHLLTIRRCMSVEKTKVFVNDRLVTLNTLRSLVHPLIDLTHLSAPLLEVTGQFENRQLVDPSYQLILLDTEASRRFADDGYTEIYDEFQKEQVELERLRSHQLHVEQKLDYLLYQKKELDQLNLNLERDSKLEEEIQTLRSQAKIVEFKNLAREALSSEGSNSILETLGNLSRQARALSQIPELSNWVTRLLDLRSSLEELSFELEQILPDREGWEVELEQKMERLSMLRRLQKKFGPTVFDLIHAHQKIQQEIDELQGIHEQIEKIEQNQRKRLQCLWQKAKHRHEVRLDCAREISMRVNHELRDLNMKGVSFAVSLQDKSELDAFGCTEVVFGLQSSQDSPIVPLSRGASGGELSRVLLALKTVLRQEAWPRTYLFDEVDTGVSGATALKVGKKLREVARSCGQVLVVTHLPQVAAFADHHFVVEKKESVKGPEVVVKKLDSEERVQAIARLVSGQKVTLTSMTNAREILEQAHDSGVP